MIGAIAFLLIMVIVVIGIVLLRVIGVILSALWVLPKFFMCIPGRGYCCRPRPVQSLDMPAVATTSGAGKSEVALRPAGPGLRARASTHAESAPVGPGPGEWQCHPGQAEPLDADGCRD